MAQLIWLAMFFSTLKTAARLLYRATVLKSETTPLGGRASLDFVYQFSELPNAEVEVVNNIVWPLPNTTGGIGHRANRVRSAVDA